MLWRRGVRLMTQLKPARRRTDCVWPALIKRSIAVLNELLQGGHRVSRRPTAGELRLGTREGIATGPVWAVIDQLSRQYPRISVQLATDNIEKLVDQLTARNIEIVVIRIAEPIIDRRLAVEYLFEHPFIVAAGASSPWI